MTAVMASPRPGADGTTPPPRCDRSRRVTKSGKDETLSKKESHLAQDRHGRVDPLHIHRAQAEDRNHRRIALAMRDTVVVGSLSGSLDVSARSDRNAVLGQKIISAVDKPGTGHDDANPVGYIRVRCAEPKGFHLIITRYGPGLSRSP